MDVAVDNMFANVNIPICLKFLAPPITISKRKFPAIKDP
jgi:hypothetical protein